MPDEPDDNTRLRVVLTGSDDPPTAAEWATGEDVSGVAPALARMRELAAAVGADEIAFVWAGHNVVSISGSRHAERRWCVLLCLRPPGWPNPERERQEADWRSGQAHKLAQAEAARIAKAAAVLARKELVLPQRDSSMDAIR